MDTVANKKLSKKDIQKLWGEDGPYSEVSLKEETRILDNNIARVFLIVEASINPFTFEYVQSNRHRFANDPMILDLLDHAENQGGRDGYVVCAGMEELRDKTSFNQAFLYREVAIENILKMHNFVIQEFGLRKTIPTGIKVKDMTIIQNNKYIWGEVLGEVKPVDPSIWEDQTSIKSPAGQKNGKIRYFIIFVLTRDVLTKNDIAIMCPEIIKVSEKYNIDVEDMEGDRGYLILTTLISPEIATLDFIEDCISSVNQKSLLFENEHFITNTGRPTFTTIQKFLRRIEK